MNGSEAKLCHSINSVCAQKVRIALKEKRQEATDKGSGWWPARPSSHGLSFADGGLATRAEGAPR
jgi:hypothetical protein